MTRRPTVLRDRFCLSTRGGWTGRLTANPLALTRGSMLWSASQARGLVIEPFSVSQELAQRDVTGQVLLNRPLDGLSEMGEKAMSSRPPNTFASNMLSASIL